MSNKCQHIISIGKNKGNQCTKNGIHAFGTLKYCKKHYDIHSKKEDIKDINNDPIFNDKVDTNEPATRKSIFNITVNTNKVYNSMSDDEKKKFKQVVEYVFHKDNIIKYLKDMTNPEDATVNLVNLQTDYAFEVGGSLNRLHVHGYVDVTHTGIMQLSTHLLRIDLNKYLDTNVHFNVQAQKSPSRIAYEKYIKKNKELP